MYQRTWVSRHMAPASPLARLTNRTNGRPPAIMATTSTHSTASFFQAVIEGSRVEKPPVETAAIAWVTASNSVMPLKRSATVVMAVRVR